jgi:hypothetical protein
MFRMTYHANDDIWYSEWQNILAFYSEFSTLIIAYRYMETKTSGVSVAIMFFNQWTR